MKIVFLTNIRIEEVNNLVKIDFIHEGVILAFTSFKTGKKKHSRYLSNYLLIERYKCIGRVKISFFKRRKFTENKIGFLAGEHNYERFKVYSKNRFSPRRR